MKKLFCVMMLPAIFASCSKFEKLENNLDKTTKKTASMSGTTAQMQKTTETMKEMTGLMFKEVRQKESKDTRIKELEIIRRKDTQMGEKLTSAAAYFKALEFQLWTGLEFDTLEYREQMMAEGMNELFRKLTDVYENLQKKRCPLVCKKRIEAMSPLKIQKRKIDERTFYAFATTMHMNNIHQSGLFKKENFSHATLTSTYDIITTALIKELNGNHLNEAEEVIVRGQNKEISVALLKARINFITALAIKDMTVKKSMTDLNKLNALLFQITSGALGNIILDSEFEESNTTTQHDINSKLAAALKTKSILRSLGIEFYLNNSLFSILDNLKVDQLNTTDSVTTEFLMLISELTTE
jgi:hypothetical protein